MNDYVDEFELENDAAYKNCKTPQEIMEYKFEVVYKRDWKAYLQSIEWDTWCKPNDPVEVARIIKEEQIRKHPFNKFF